MCNRWVGTGLLLAALTAAGPGAGSAAAQANAMAGPMNATPGNLGLGYTGNPEINSPLPIGPDHGGMDGGIYGAAEFLFFNQGRGAGETRYRDKRFRG